MQHQKSKPKYTQTTPIQHTHQYKLSRHNQRPR